MRLVAAAGGQRSKGATRSPSPSVARNTLGLCNTYRPGFRMGASQRLEDRYPACQFTQHVMGGLYRCLIRNKDALLIDVRPGRVVELIILSLCIRVRGFSGASLERGVPARHDKRVPDLPAATRTGQNSARVEKRGIWPCIRQGWSGLPRLAGLRPSGVYYAPGSVGAEY